MSIVTAFTGGLGNQLFMIAGNQTIAEQTNRQLIIPYRKTPPTHHSSHDYFQTIFSNFKVYQKQITEEVVSIEEPSYQFYDWNTLIHTKKSVEIRGYFQNYRYISPKFIQMLSLPNTETLPGAFLHVRGGDYITWGAHEFHFDLTNYYEAAVKLFPEDTHFYIFTNDKPYAKSLPILSKIKHTIIDETDEVRAITLMSRCTKGGICPNSTFSWWGAYLNPNRTIVLPDKWFKVSKIYTEGYFFPGAHVLPV